MGDRPTTRTRWAAVLAGAASAAMLAVHVTASLSAVPQAELFKWWHYWSEVAIASEYVATGDFPVAPFPVTDKPRVSARYRRQYLESSAGLRAWQALRTIEVPVTGERHALRRFDDPGRPLLLAIVFRVLGGTAPFLIFWLAVVPALAVAVWTAFELCAAGRPITAWVLAVLLATSCYVAEALALSYNAAGFHLLGLLLLVPFSVYAVLRPRPTWRGLVVRTAIVVLALGVVALCRSGGLLLLPGFGLALLVAAARLDGAPRSRWLRAAGLIALLPLPWLGLYTFVARGAERTFAKYGTPGKPLRHDIWCSAWKGLGDFDRTKEHVWDDNFVRRAIAEAGGHGYLKLRHERLCRDRFLSDVAQDPLWYAGILARRVAATVTQSRLRPWTPRDGVAVAGSTHPNEGLIDSYYGLTATADWFELAGARVESPVLLLLVPLPLMLAGAWVTSASRARLREALVVVGVVAAAALTLPVLMTTGGGIETQAFVLVHFLAWAFVAEEAARYAVRSRRAPPDGAAGG